MILLTPGPCMTSEAVRAAAALPDLGHREPEVEALLSEGRERLRHVYSGTENWVSYLIGGSGTAAVEASLTSCIQHGPVLVIANGYYSDRLDEILQVHGIEHRKLEFPWTRRIEVDAVEEALHEKRYEAILLTHNETTLGRLNPVEAIAEIAKATETRVIVDAMSSFGADPLVVENIDVLISSANKCLHGLPGVSFVLVKPDLAQEMRRYRRRTYYLSLPMYEQEAPPLTPPVSILRAFVQALREFESQGGLTGRHEDYIQRANLLRTGLVKFGLDFAVVPEEASCTMSAPTLPTGWNADAWFAANRERGFVLYACKGKLRERFFLAANMGELNRNDLERWLQVVLELI